MPDHFLPVAPLKAWVKTLFQREACAEQEADIVAHNLVWNSQIQRDSYGLGRLDVLLSRLKCGFIQAPCQLEFKRVAGSLIMCQGNNGLGQYIGDQAMNQAIQMAAEQGLCAVSVRDSNWNGSGAYFVNLAAEAGMIGLCTSNAFAKVPAYQGDMPVLGTNPLAFGAPRPNGAHLLLDMSTSNWSGGRVRQALQTGGFVPEDALGPLGGAKGYGLALMVEVLSALLSGAGRSTELGSMFDTSTQGKLQGQFYLALDIKKLTDVTYFEQAMELLIAELHASGEQVLYPGEQRWQAFHKSLEQGVQVPESTYKKLQHMAELYALPLSLN